MVIGTRRTGRAVVKWWVDTQVYFFFEWWGLVGWLVGLERVRGRTRKMGWIVVR